jgi:hypothetical protein
MKIQRNILYKWSLDAPLKPHELKKYPEGFQRAMAPDHIAMSSKMI